MKNNFENFIKSLKVEPILENTILNGFNVFYEAMENKYKDKIPGGLADKKKPEDFDQVQLNKGIKVELEHTSNEEMAREIAMDHLMEDKNYYTKLEKVEK